MDSSVYTYGGISTGLILSWLVRAQKLSHSLMKISRSALLPYSAENMYNVVADIASYPEFLNWCKGTKIVSETPDEVVAELIIAYGVLDFSFSTRNIMAKDQSIQLSLVDGPFSDLQGEWTFTSLDKQACKVALEMDFVFENSLTHKVFSGVFQKVVSKQLEAFQKRAQSLFEDQRLGEH